MTVLHLPTNSGGDGTLAVLPWFTEELDLEGLGMDRQGWEQGGSQCAPSLLSLARLHDTNHDSFSRIPYAPSHLIPLSSLQPSTIPTTSAAARLSTLGSTTSTTANAFLPIGPPPIRNLVGLTFLPGFTEPTLALLYAPDYTWSGRLEHLAHNHLVSLVTLSTRSTAGGAKDEDDPSSSSSGQSQTTLATLISTSPPLPYSLLSIQPVPAAMGIGSVLLKSANGVLLLDIQGGKLVGAASNTWFGRDFPPGRPLPVGLERTTTTSSSSIGDGSGSHDCVGETFEGSVISFLGDPNQETTSTSMMDNKALVFCKSGTVCTLEVERVGRSISGLRLSVLRGARCDGGVSCAVRVGPGLLFVGAEQASSKLCRVTPTATGELSIKRERTSDPDTVAARIDDARGQDDAMDEDDEGACSVSPHKTF